MNADKCRSRAPERFVSSRLSVFLKLINRSNRVRSYIEENLVRTGLVDEPTYIGGRALGDRGSPADPVADPGVRPTFGPPHPETDPC